MDALFVVGLLKANPVVNDRLREATKVPVNWGRQRLDGDWHLVMVAMICSRSTDIEPFYAASTMEMWRECGFTARPSFTTTWERLTELETRIPQITEVAHQVVRHAAKASGGLVGRDLHIDGTEAETHAALVHDCQQGDECGRPKRRFSTRKARSVPRVPTSTVRSDRQSEAEEASVDEGGIAPPVEPGSKRIKGGKCWYQLRDDTAGVRAYTGPRGGGKFWAGFYQIKMIDHYTGATIASVHVPASTQEHLTYVEVLDKAIAASGAPPRAVVGDRGFSIRSVFAETTGRGIAPVFPYRKTVHEKVRRDRDEFDRHGIPRCKHCGGPGQFVRFNNGQGKNPRLWYSCERKHTPGCAKVQTISCTTNPKFLLPLWRTSEAYHALRQSHNEYERVHHRDRQVWGVAGDTVTSRPKRRGIAWQQVRAEFVRIAQWMLICWREGWFGTPRRNTNTAQVHRGEYALDRLIKSRRKHGLHIPYGKAAKALIAKARGPAPPGPAAVPAPPAPVTC